LKVTNCKKCGRVMQYNHSELCSKCTDSEKDLYQKVRDYVFNHRGATIPEVSEATGASRAAILRYLREDKLSLVEERTLLPKCKSCGTLIQMGDICNDCNKKKLREGLKSSANKKANTGFGRSRRR